MHGKWYIPEFPSPSVFTLSPPRPRCVRLLERPKCRVCHEALKQKELIHPVECYRLWDENLSTVEEIEHLSAVWQMVAPFLKEHGYTLVPPQDVKTPFESIGDILHGFDNVEPGSRIYPAWDRFGDSVYIKMVPLYHPTSQEFRVWSHLDGPLLRDDPRNHSVSPREVLIFSPDFTSAGFISQRSDRRAFVVIERYDQLGGPKAHLDAPVTSLLRNMEDYFKFVTQIVEGFAFMHEHGIAHRNFNERNILAQWTGLNHQWLIADYELSVLVNVPGPWTMRQSTLEESKSFGALGRRYDPFAADIRRLGSTIESLTSALSGSGDPQWFRAHPADYMLLLGEMQVLDPKFTPPQPTITTVQRRVSYNFYPPKESALSEYMSYVRSASETVVSGGGLLLGTAAGLVITQRPVGRQPALRR